MVEIEVLLIESDQSEHALISLGFFTVEGDFGGDDGELRKKLLFHGEAIIAGTTQTVRRRLPVGEYVDFERLYLSSLTDERRYAVQVPMGALLGPGKVKT